jgi:GNAT superfamily N-acetyltransferase
VAVVAPAIVAPAPQARTVTTNRIFQDEVNAGAQTVISGVLLLEPDAVRRHAGTLQGGTASDMDSEEAHFLTAIRQATQADVSVVREVFGEYLQWAVGTVNRTFNGTFDIPALLEHDLDELHRYLPPGGRLLLALEGTAVVGCACTHTLHAGVAELKRMYVRPDQRRQGVGRALVQSLTTELRDAGYTILRLDSARFMHEAQALYRSFGFSEIDPYPESEIPENFRKHWIFMELTL